MLPAHPVLKPALRPAWRDLNTVQFGAAPAHAVVLSPVDPTTSSLLSLMDGSRSLPLLRGEAARLGLPEGSADALVARLAEAGLLDDATADRAAAGPGPRARSEVHDLRKRPAALSRLGPDLASLSVTQREPGDPIRLMAARGNLRVQVRGAGRVGTLIASVLAGAGVGQVDVVDGDCVEPGDVAPGGVNSTHIGRRRMEAARQVVARASVNRPRRSAARSAGSEPPLALVVLAPRDGLHAYLPNEAASNGLTESGTPHLYAGVLEATGFVGPLVLPGSTACAGCVRQHRTDRDPTWPRLLAQWYSGSRRQALACDLALATAVAGLAAAHALAFLDGNGTATRAARWEATLPGLHWHARQLRPHPGCGCGAAWEGDHQGMGEHTASHAHSHDTMSV